MLDAALDLKIPSAGRSPPVTRPTGRWAARATPSG